MENMEIQMVRSYYDQSFSTYYDKSTRSIGYDFDTDEMKGLVKWLKAMEERDIEVALNMGWSVGDVFNHHCTTYSYDDCGVHGNNYETSNNSFWCLGRDTNPVYRTSTVAKAYGEWVAKSMDYLVNTCGFTNIKYLVMFTEPRQDYNLDGSYNGQWQDYRILVESAHNALVDANLRNKFSLVGPNIGFTYNGSKTDYLDKIDTVFSLESITDYIDIYSFHFYAPSWPHFGVTADNPTDNNYRLYKSLLDSIISKVNKYDPGADYWLDEWNYAGMFIDSTYYATQLAQAVVAALNSGTENVMLWQLFETKWPERNDTGGEFVNGVHKIGLAPTLTESEVPYDVYYGFSLLTKYMGKRGATVYSGHGMSGVYTAMIENEDGTQSILAVNTNMSEKSINLQFGRKINGALFRHLYNPATVNPTASAEIIGADKVFTNFENCIKDILPAGAIAVYTTER